MIRFLSIFFSWHTMKATLPVVAVVGSLICIVNLYFHLPLPAKIVLNGDSAGGHMALALALRLAKAGGPQPGKLALFAPWLDVTMQDEEMRAVEPNDFMLKIDALRALGEVSSRQARIVEYRFFGGLTVPEVADHLDISLSTVENDWRVARAWLRVRLAGKDEL